VNEEALANWGLLRQKKLIFTFHYRQDTEMEENSDVVSEIKTYDLRNFCWKRGENYFSLLNKFVSYMQDNRWRSG
jgi:hypothetical protein